MQAVMLPKKEKLTKELIVQNRSGIHARVSTMIAQRCKEFVSEVRLRKGSAVADCRSVLDLLSLGASNGTVVHLEAVGTDAAEVVNVITALFEARFNEDEESSKPPVKPAGS
jgi:phosphocarrier protein NPr/phosphocarrier protein